MAIGRRYNVEWSPGDYGMIGFNFEDVLGPGVTIVPNSTTGTPRLEVWTNEAVPRASPGDFETISQLSSAVPGNWQWILDPTSGNATWTPNSTAPSGVGTNVMNLGTLIHGRRVYSIITGGNSGVDYQFRWLLVDSLGHQWTRTGLLLCGVTA